MHLTVEPTKRLSFNGCPLDCPPDISLEALRLLCTMQTSFDHPSTMPTIRSPARIILPQPSVPDTQWHRGHPLRCPHPQSDVPWSYFSSHRHRTCNLPLPFRHLATIMPRGRTSTPIELKYTPIHHEILGYLIAITPIHPYLAPRYRIVTLYHILHSFVTILHTCLSIAASVLPATLLHNHCSPFSFPIPLASTLSISLYSDCMYQICNRRTGSPVFHSIHPPYICRLQAARLVPVQRIGIRPASL